MTPEVSGSQPTADPGIATVHRPGAAATFQAEPRWYTVASRSVAPLPGGTVAGSRYTVFVPPLALSKTTTISIREYSPDVLDFELLPHGTQFLVPVTVDVDYSGTSLDPASPDHDGGLPVLLWLDPSTGLWQLIPGVDHPLTKTFTISNVGSHGGSFATPIINYPEVCILGMSRSHIANTIRLLQLPADVQQLVADLGIAGRNGERGIGAVRDLEQCQIAAGVGNRQTGRVGQQRRGELLHLRREVHLVRQLHGQLGRRADLRGVERPGGGGQTPPDQVVERLVTQEIGRNVDVDVPAPVAAIQARDPGQVGVEFTSGCVEWIHRSARGRPHG